MNPKLGQIQYYKIPAQGSYDLASDGTPSWNVSDPSLRVAKQFDYVASPWAGNVPQGSVPISASEYKSGLETAARYGDDSAKNELQKLSSGEGVYADGYRSPQFSIYKADATTPTPENYTPEFAAQDAKDFANFKNQNAKIAAGTMQGQTPNQVAGTQSSPANPLAIPAGNVAPPQMQTPQGTGASFPTQNLQPGMTGDAVKQLQQYLMSQGLLTAEQIATGPGIYGPATTAAVKALQQKLGIDNSTGPGYWGPMTISAASKATQTSTNTNAGTTSTAPGSDQWSSIISGSPFVSDLLRDPAQKAKFDNLPDDLKGAFLQTAISLGKSVEAGKVVNPNLEITPAKAAEFLSQATSELDPYYQEKLGALKNDFQTSTSRLMEDYTTGAKRSGDTFKQTLDTNAESEAQGGTAFSSGRLDRENRTVTLEQNALDDAFKTAQRTAQDNATKYEQSAGSSALRSLDLPTLSGYTASNTGVAQGPASSLYTPLGTTAIGTVPGQEKVDIANRSSDLESAYRTSRNLDLSSLS